MGLIFVTPDLSIDERELEFRFIRSSGPGGQKVNKVSTAVQLRFNVKDSPALTEPVKERLIQLAGKRMSDEGILTIEARSYRTQERNRQDALDRLVKLLTEASREPKKRKKTRPSKAVVERRLAEKRHRGEKKRHRKKPTESIDG